MATGEQWQIKLFGGVRAERKDRVLTHLRTQKTAALLGYLALHANQPTDRELLIDMLWQDAQPASGRHNLSMALSFLRTLLKTEDDTPILITNRQLVQLNPDLFVVDVIQFTHLLQLARNAPEPERVSLLSQAVNLYQGDLMRGYYFGWIVPQAVRLEEQFNHAVHQLMGLLERAGNREQALNVGLNALVHIPLHEGTHLEVMRLQTALGQSENALRQYEYCRQLLKERLGAQPSDVLRELADQIHQQSHRAIPNPPEQAPASPTTLDMETALDWTFAHLPERALLLVLALTPLWERQAHWEQATHWIERALTHPNLEPTARAHLLMQMARFAFRLGAYEQAEQGVHQALLLFHKSGDIESIAEAAYMQGRIAEARCAYGRAATLYRQAHTHMQDARNARGASAALSGLGHLQTLRGRFEEAEEVLQNALQLARECRDAERESVALHNLAFLKLWQAQPHAALPLYEQALNIRQTTGDRLGIAAMLNGMGRTFLELGDVARAIELCTESITIRRAIGDRPGLAHACCFLACAHLRQKQTEHALTLFEQSLSICREFGNHPYEIMNLEGQAITAFQSEQHEKMNRLLEEAFTLRRTFGLPLPPIDQPAIEPLCRMSGIETNT